MTNDEKNMSDEQLIKKADNGMQGLGSIVKTLIRTEKGQGTIKKLTVAILFLTSLLLIAAAATIYLQWQVVYPQPKTGVSTDSKASIPTQPEKESTTQ